MGLSIKYDYRLDPFTEADQAIDVVDELKTCPANSPFYVDLEEVPREDSPTSITAYDNTGAVALTEVSTNPSTNEFRVDYKYGTGKVMLHSSAANHVIKFNYKGTGHSIASSIINALSDWLGKNYTPGDDHNHDGTNSKTVVNISGNAATAANATNAATAANATAIADGVVSTEAKIASNVVSQSKLKTATQEISAGNDAGFQASPGGCNREFTSVGSYGFYPQTKIGGEISTQTVRASLAYDFHSETSFKTYIGLERLGCDGNNAKTVHAQMRYVQSSGNDMWVFLMVAKKDYTEEDGFLVKKGAVICGYAAPDHPCYGTGKDEEEYPYPMDMTKNKYYDPEKHAIVLLDNDEVHEIMKKVDKNPDDSLLSAIHREYVVDLDSEPVFTPRDIIEIDKFGAKKGEVISKIKVPEWAKIAIGEEEVELRKRTITQINEFVAFKKLKLKKGGDK